MMKSDSKVSDSVSSALLIYNGRSGGFNRRFLQRFEGYISKAGCHLEVVDIADIPSDFSGFDRVAVAGGDGTVNTVAHRLKNLGIPLLTLPLGTGNLIAQNLGIPKSASKLAHIFLEGTPRTYDLALLTAGDIQTGFTMMAGAGLDADVIRDSEPLKANFGVGAYILGLLKQLSPREVQFQLTLDGQTQISTQGMGILIANFGLANFQLPIVTGISAQDGFLDVIVMKGKTPLSLIPHLMDSIRGKLGFGDPIFEDRLEIFACKRLILETEPILPIQYDGELLEAETPMEACVLPKAIPFLVP